MAKKYVSVFNNGQEDLYLKDTEARDGLLHPVDIDSLTPTSTFVKNAVIGINGVIYKSKKATSNFPVTLTIQNGAFVTHSVNGKTAFVVSDETLNGDWIVWTDAAIEYWTQQLSQRTTALENARTALESRASALEDSIADVTYNGQSYTLQQLMQAMAQLMENSVVINA